MHEGEYFALDLLAQWQLLDAEQMKSVSIPALQQGISLLVNFVSIFKQMMLCLLIQSPAGGLSEQKVHLDRCVNSPQAHATSRTRWCHTYAKYVLTRSLAVLICAVSPSRCSRQVRCVNGSAMFSDHLYSHLGLRPSACQVCTQRFVRTQGLDRHIATKHQEN